MTLPIRIPDPFEEMERLPFTCGKCGRAFETKGEKRRHRPACQRHLAEVKERADREWAEIEACHIPQTIDEHTIHARKLAKEWKAIKERLGQ